MNNPNGATEPQVVLERMGEHVAVIRLNRPTAHNAISVAMAEAIETYAAEIEADPAIRVAIVAARGKSFCAGADLKEVAAGRGLALSRPETGFAGFVWGRKVKPWIAAVQGAALGGGTEIALACDMVVAGEEASFGLPEARRGLIAGAGGAFRIARAVPRAIALEVVATGVALPAQRAFDLGLVNRIVPTDRVMDEALALANAIAANSPLAVRESLIITRAASGGDEEARLRQIQDAAVERVLAAPDLIEGATAFSEKRAPVWRT
ncbi:MAG: enoyl-CoA hydratase-related protein [Sphingomonadaceae bacterium]